MFLNKKKKMFEQALDRFSETPMEHSITAHQDFLNHHLNLLYDHYAKTAPEHIPVLQTMPFKDAWFVIRKITTMGLTEGATALAFVTRERSVPPETEIQVPLEEFSVCYFNVREEDTSENQAFQAATEGNEVLDYLATAIAHWLVGEVIEEFPVLQPSKDDLLGFAYSTVMDGIYTEFATIHMQPMTKTYHWLMQQIHEKLTGGHTDEEGNPVLDPKVLQQLIEKLDIDLTQNVYPWPKDLRCLCHADLRPFMFCCKADHTIDPVSLPAELDPDYTHECEDCQTPNNGFTCDRCGRSYSWQKGIVPSLNGLQ